MHAFLSDGEELRGSPVTFVIKKEATKVMKMWKNVRLPPLAPPRLPRAPLAPPRLSRARL